MQDESTHEEGMSNNLKTLPILRRSTQSSIDSQLKSILEEFRSFKESWSKDKTSLNQQLSHLEEQANFFAKHIKDLKELNSSVRERREDSIGTTVTRCAEELGERLGKEAARTTEFVARQLAKAAYKAQDVLERYQSEILMAQWRIIGVAVFTTITTCLLLVFFLIPKPTLSLSQEQIKYLNNGEKMALMWPTLSEWERARWATLLTKSDT